MAGENPDILRSTQIGIQSTFGTAVGANIVLPGVTIDLKPIVANVLLTQRGSKIATDQVATKGSHTTGALSGWASYNDLPFLCSMLCKAATVTNAGSGAYDWTFLLPARQAEVPILATVENGLPNVDACRAGDMTLRALSMAFEQNREIALTGDLLGTLLAEELTALSAVTYTAPSVPISVDLMDAFVSDTYANLFSSYLAKMYAANFSFGDRRAAVFPIRSAVRSIGGYVETRNSLTSHIEIEHDAQSYQIMRALRACATRYIGYKTIGPLISTGVNYSLEISHAAKIENPDRGPRDEVYGGMYDFSAVEDAAGAIGGFIKIVVRCAVPGTAISTPGTNLPSNQQPNTQVGVQQSQTYTYSQAIVTG